MRIRLQCNAKMIKHIFLSKKVCCMTRLVGHVSIYYVTYLLTYYVTDGVAYF